MEAFGRGLGVTGLGRVIVVAVMFVSAGVLAYEATTEEVEFVVPEQAPHSVDANADKDQLLRALAAREQEIEALKQKLAAVDDSALYAKAERAGVVSAVRKANLTDLQKRRLAVAIVREAEKNGIDPLLVVAVIRTESSFNNFAVSEVGAMGLMQVMPETGKYLMTLRGERLTRPTNLFDFELNIQLGTSYLADLIRRFGTVEAALVAYNAGPGNAKKILKSKTARPKFMAGYPKKVVGEWKKLRTASSAIGAQK